MTSNNRWFVLATVVVVVLIYFAVTWNQYAIVSRGTTGAAILINTRTGNAWVIYGFNEERAIQLKPEPSPTPAP